MALFHFSEDPSIEFFTPHVARTSAVRDEALVWAIDEWHAPMYFTPRDCPRACFWIGERTSDDDGERFLHGLSPHFVMVIETGWLERLRDAILYRYRMAEATFAAFDRQAGHYVSHEGVRPLAVDPVGDPLMAIAQSGVELRVTPRLGPLWRRVSASTLEFSGTRLWNAIGYPTDFE